MFNSLVWSSHLAGCHIIYDASSSGRTQSKTLGDCFHPVFIWVLHLWETKDAQYWSFLCIWKLSICVYQVVCRNIAWVFIYTTLYLEYAQVFSFSYKIHEEVTAFSYVALGEWAGSPLTFFLTSAGECFPRAGVWGGSYPDSSCSRPLQYFLSCSEWLMALLNPKPSVPTCQVLMDQMGHFLRLWLVLCSTEFYLLWRWDSSSRHLHSAHKPLSCVTFLWLEPLLK